MINKFENTRDIKAFERFKDINQPENNKFNFLLKNVSYPDSDRPNNKYPVFFEKECITNEQKSMIKKETNWSDKIVNNLNSIEEFKVYKKAGLNEAEIDGKECLIRSDINWEQKDVMGRTNIERSEQGLSPINKDGKVIELHHIGQHSDSPLAELTPEEHRGKGNDTILHNKTKESEIDRQAFAIERNAHWQARSNS